MCKGFGSSLTGPALQRFIGLPNNSISSFAELHDRFVEQFSSSRKMLKRSDDLYSIRQNVGEPLRDFVARFNREKVSITYCSQETAMSAFRKGLLRDSDLYKELTKYPCETMEDVLNKASSQIKWEEDECNQHRQIAQRTDRDSRPSRRMDQPTFRTDFPIHRQRRFEPYQRNPRSRPIVDETRPNRKIPEYNLCISPSECVYALKGLGNAVRWPQKIMSAPDKRDKMKFCDFHGDHGHRTNECIALKFEVVELLRKGFLVDLLTDKGKQTWNGKESSRTRPNDPPKKPFDQPEIPRADKTINCISGGSEISGVSRASAKRHCRNLQASLKFQSPNESLEHSTIDFSSEEASSLSHPHHDALVISILISNCLIKRTLVDNGSSTNVVFLSTLKEMQVPQSQIVKKFTTLIGFSGEHKQTLGEVTLAVFSEGLNTVCKFQVIDAPSAYNVILGRPWIHEIKGVRSTYHQLIKFPTPWEVRSIMGEQLMARDCYRTSFKSNLVHVEAVNYIDEASCSFSQSSTDSTVQPSTDSTVPTDPDQSTIQESSVEDLDEVQIHPDFPDHVVLIGARLEADLRSELLAFLSEHHDCFAWSHTDMTGIYPSIVTRRLQIDPFHIPVKQKRRKFVAERNGFIDEEVRKLIEAGSVIEIQYPNWLTNVVIVKNKNGKTRMCFDFTDLNKACPKDSFLLPHTDSLVDSTAINETHYSVRGPECSPQRKDYSKSATVLWNVGPSTSSAPTIPRGVEWG